MIKEFVLILAVWRATSLLVNEDGPFDIFAKFRKFIGIYYDEYSQPQGKNVAARAFTCIWCTSVWVALAATFFSDNATSIPWFLVEWLFISAGAIITDEIIGAIGRSDR